jgi:uncharacterized DUF497 family protein
MEFDWDADNEQHIARHGINPKEAEEAILIEPLETDVQPHESGSVVVCRAGTSSLRLFAEGRFTHKRRDESLTS